LFGEAGTTAFSFFNDVVEFTTALRILANLCQGAVTLGDFTLGDFAEGGTQTEGVLAARQNFGGEG